MIVAATEPLEGGTLVIEELPPPDPIIPSIMLIDRSKLVDLARHRGLSRFLTNFPSRR